MVPFKILLNLEHFLSARSTKVPQKESKNGQRPTFPHKEQEWNER